MRQELKIVLLICATVLLNSICAEAQSQNETSRKLQKELETLLQQSRQHHVDGLKVFWKNASALIGVVKNGSCDENNLKLFEGIVDERLQLVDVELQFRKKTVKKRTKKDSMLKQIPVMYTLKELLRHTSK